MLAMDEFLGGGGGGFWGAEFGGIPSIADSFGQGRLSAMGWDFGGFDIPNVNVDMPSEISIAVPDITLGGGSIGAGGGDARARAVSLVNSAETLLQQNLAEYRAQRISASTCAEKFDQIWSALVQRLQALGGEGTRAIADRQSGGKFDWFLAYRPQGIPLSPGVPSTGTPFEAGLTPRFDSNLLIVLAVIAGLALVGRKFL